MTKRENVLRAIRFENPRGIPLWFFNKDFGDSDIISFELSPFRGGNIQMSEWGYRWENIGDGTIGCPRDAVMRTWDAINDFSFPVANKNDRFIGLEEKRREYKDSYFLAELGITGFNTFIFLRGYEDGLIDIINEDSHALWLIEKIMGFEIQLIKAASRHGFDGIHFADDWGSQRGLLIDPELWRKIFKPRYRDQFKIVHEHKLHVWFHSCGDIGEIIMDLHEIGADVINISQPNVVDLVRVGKTLRGRQCFLVPISYQTIGISSSPEEILREGRRLRKELGTDKGGFIGYIEEYGVMGMSEENYKACSMAFSSL